MSIEVTTYGSEPAIRMVSAHYAETELIIYLTQDPAHEGQCVFAVDTGGLSMYLRFRIEDVRKLPEMLDEMHRRSTGKVKG